MRRTGFRGRLAALHSAYQLAEAKRLADQAEAEGGRYAELRPATYCGPGSAGDRGAAILAIDGRIYAVIEREALEPDLDTQARYA